jgi:hypothetical protein
VSIGVYFHIGNKSSIAIEAAGRLQKKKALYSAHFYVVDLLALLIAFCCYFFSVQSFCVL